MRLKNGKELSIEQAAPKDAEEILAYLNQVGGESHNLTFGKDEFTLTVDEEAKLLQQIQEHPLDQMWKGVVDGKIISVLNFQSFPKKRQAHRGGLGISVLRSYWQMGIGKAMLTHLLTYVQGLPEITMLSLEVVTDNTSAIHLYQTLGFHIEGTYHKYTKVDDVYYDAYYMEQEISHT